MAKSQIKKLKADRFWRWLHLRMAESPEHEMKIREYYKEHPIRKNRHGWRVRGRFLKSARLKGRLDAAFQKVLQAIQETEGTP